MNPIYVIAFCVGYTDTQMHVYILLPFSKTCVHFCTILLHILFQGLSTQRVHFMFCGSSAASTH